MDGVTLSRGEGPEASAIPEAPHPLGAYVPPASSQPSTPWSVESWARDVGLSFSSAAAGDLTVSPLTTTPVTDPSAAERRDTAAALLALEAPVAAEAKAPSQTDAGPVDIPQTPPQPPLTRPPPTPSPATPPHTPPRAARPPHGRPAPSPRPWGTPDAAAGRASPFCTPPPPKGQRPPRTVHNPYLFGAPPSTPPQPARSPAGRYAGAAMVRSSPKPRTPTRTRLAVQMQNTTPAPALNLGLAWVNTAQTGFNMALAATPASTPASNSPGYFPASPLCATSLLRPLYPPTPEPAAAAAIPSPPAAATAAVPHAVSENDILALFHTPAASGIPLTRIDQPLGRRVVFPPSGSPEGDGASPASAAATSVGPSPAYSARHRSLTSPSPAPTPTRALGSPLMFPGTPKAVPNAIFVLVEFKRGRVMQFQCPFIIQPGEYVMVDGDDGTDMGMVIDSWVAHADSPPRVNNSQNSNRLSLLSNLDPVTGTPTRFPTYPKVIRRATQDEVAYLHGPLAAAEKKCTEIARRKARDLGLPMSILDAEYQFDCRKLTFYFDSRERVEFQRLLHELFAIYHVRIWMATVRPRVPYGPPKVQSPAQAQGQHQPQAQYQVPAVQ